MGATALTDRCNQSEKMLANREESIYVPTLGGASIAIDGLRKLSQFYGPVMGKHLARQGAYRSVFPGKTPAPQSTHKVVPMTQETSGKYARQNAIDLSSAASKWLISLDEKVRPKHLPEQYPRIVNRMAELWQHPELMRTYFEEIMVDTRGNRAGFSGEVVIELGSLKHHYNRVLFPIKIDVWDKIWSKMN